MFRELFKFKILNKKKLISNKKQKVVKKIKNIDKTLGGIDKLTILAEIRLMLKKLEVS
uniref:Uncharacterized protein n=1 Tax=Rhizophagus irregularis (strain DAOM 181602 / DAOM 197198 / MUCL 43194) TaxID=747089 RepID=U9U3Y4_RHIID